MTGHQSNDFFQDWIVQPMTDNAAATIDSSLWPITALITNSSVPISAETSKSATLYIYQIVKFILVSVLTILSKWMVIECGFFTKIRC